MHTESRAVLAALYLSLGAASACTGSDAETAPDVVSRDTGDGSDVRADVGPETTDATSETTDSTTDVVDGPIDLALPAPAGRARAGIATKPEDLLDGPKAEGRVGDVKLYNTHAAFIVEAPRRAGGWRTIGGHVADTAVVRPDGSTTPDMYGELFTIWDMAVFRAETIEVLNDGRDGGAAHVRLSGATGPTDIANGFIGDLLGGDPPGLDVVFDYRLGPDDRALALTITLSNPKDEDVEVGVAAAMATHGDGALEYIPGFGFDADAGAGSVMDYFGAVGRELATGMWVEPRDQTLTLSYVGITVLSRDGFTVPAGSSVERKAWFAPSDNGAAGVDAIRRAYRGETGALVSGTVTIPSSADERGAWVGVWQDGIVVTTAPVRGDGTFQAEVTPGAYEVRAYLPQHLASPPVTVEAIEATSAEANPSIPAAAVVTARVTDVDSGEVIPARVTFFRQGDTPSPHPPRGVAIEVDWGNAISGVAYAVPGGGGELRLPAGTYRAVASRGPSWEIAEQTLTVEAGDVRDVELALKQAVDTTGWVAADFHIHAERSPDSEVPYDLRALQAITDDVDVPILTEHIQIGRFGSVLADLGLQDVLVDVTAQEVTTLEYGHFGAFPLVEDPSAVNRGAVYPHDKDAPDLFEAMRTQHGGETLIQVNHPRGFLAFSYFDFVGFDPASATPGNPAEWSTDWDTVEVFNETCATTGSNGKALADWVGLTNHGYRKALSSGSDSHAEQVPGGIPRNWLPLTAAALREDQSGLVATVRARQMVVSCGPFVRFEAEDGTVMGGMTGVDAAGAVRFNVKVEAPTWMTVDEVRLLENGEPIDIIDLHALAGDSSDPVVRLETVLVATPATDAWYALEVRGSGGLMPVYPLGSPYALTNPIEVDADGDGDWTAPALQ